MSGPSPRKRSKVLIRLVETSPLIVVALLAAVLLSLPRDLSTTLIGQVPPAIATGQPMNRTVLGQMADILNHSKDIKGLDLTDVDARGGMQNLLATAAGKAWWDLQWRQDEYFSVSTITPNPFPASDKVYASLSAWERTHDARIWVWVLPVGDPPPLAIRSIGSVKRLNALKAQIASNREALDQAAGPITDRDIVAALNSDAMPQAGMQALNPPRLGANGGGGSNEYMVWDFTSLQGRDVYKYYLVAQGDDYQTGSQAEISSKEAERNKVMDGLMSIDPRLPEAKREADRVAKELRGNVFVVGPLDLKAIPLRVPKGATLDEARKLGDWGWPSKMALDQWPNNVLVTLPATEAALTGDRAIAFFVTHAGNNSLGSPAVREGQIAPQTLLVAATYRTYPGYQPTAVERLLRRWQRFVASVFPWIAGAFAALLAVSLVASPLAFVYDRRRTARERVLAEMELVRRDAHDRVYNRLSALSKTVALASAGTPEETAARLKAAADDIRGTVGELQDILGSEKRHENAALTTVPLADQLTSVCSAQAARHRVEIDCAAATALPDAPAELGWDLQCVAEEAITNAIRHGAATSIAVSLAYAPVSRELHLEVADDGSGSTVSSAAEAAPDSRGLRSMHERVSRWHGELAIESSSAGTTLVATFVVPAAPAV